MADRLIRFHVDLFVSDAGPDPLDEYVVTLGPLCRPWTVARHGPALPRWMHLP